MIRNCSEIPLNDLKNQYNINNIYNIYLYVDNKNKSEIYRIIENNKDRFKRGIYTLLQWRYNNELYGKEEFSKKSKGITAFKFKKRKNSNYRIYCKEIFDESSLNVKKVIMVFAYNKKTQKIDKKLKQLIEKISKYDYEI